MDAYKNNRTQLALGHRNPQGCLQLAVRLDPEVFSRLKVQALKDKMSLAAKIRDYVDLGLDIDFDIERDLG